MSLFDLIATLLVLAAALGYLNYRLLKLPPSVGLMALTLLASVVVVGVGQLAPRFQKEAETFVHQLHLDETLLHGMLGFLLFAGALHIELEDLAQYWLAVGVLATLAVVLSTVIVGALSWLVLSLLGMATPFLYCLLFGALISPTDPIAVLSLLKQIGAPRPLKVQIAGESLFNDGVGVVLFLGLQAAAQGGGAVDPFQLGLLFVRETLGGAALGLLAGLLVYWMLRSVDNYQLEILLSLALVAGGYGLAERLHVSGPIAMVVAGLLIGNHGRKLAMSATTVEHLDLFWELIDEILNAMLFVLLGLEVLVLTFTGIHLTAGLIMIPAVLLARLISVGLPFLALRHWQKFVPGTVRVLTWGGLRGGISVALALALPKEIAGQPNLHRQTFLAITYVVVVFSILVQGLTIGPLTRRWVSEKSARLEGATAD